ncbi:HAMP domain-containing sensor histidine kinase [Actinophytocola xinjiangensis]|uniref:HAMP domain-containing sensor histidine kinase n=1 Tax=Actinophytocola xinjiangensis TaxID=485602 RepID=UPI000AD7D0CE|nr:ATP-binding protein [Actinophytocola xinjiangensis]
MSEPGRRDVSRWQVSGWPLRTKVAVVLVVPAVVALVLGGLRVQSQLDEAAGLSTVRDRLTVLTESLTLADLIGVEMVDAAVGGAGDSLDTSVARVDQQIAVLRSATDFAGLPDTVAEDLRVALERLATLRALPADDPVAVSAGYREVLATLADLVPAVVSLARNEELDDRASAVASLSMLRAALASETALIRSGVDGARRSAMIAAAQQAVTEEVVRGQQLRAELTGAWVTRLDDATLSVAQRQSVLRAAVAGERIAPLPTLLLGLDTTSEGMAALLDDVVADLSTTVSARTDEARADALRDTAVVLGALLAALAIALAVARSLLSPLHRLRSAALHAANERLPETVERVRAGEQVDYRSVEPVPVHTEEEVGQLARAFDDMHRQAVRLAGEQAELRLQVSEMFMTLSRRSQSLVESQLTVIEELESDEQDPRRLAGLFRLDHLATRLRRNGENLQVLAGGTPPRRGSRPVDVVEVLRAATSEITDYQRVSLGNAPGAAIRASAAADVVHILAELLENATRFSPPEQRVVLTADRGSDGGLLFEVVDSGLGMAADDLAAANDRLSTPDVVDPETTRRMGLFVVSQLAARHGITVTLRPTHDSATQAGVTAGLHVPGTLVIADGTPPPALAPAPVPELVAAGAAPAEPVDWFTPVVEADPPPLWPTEAPDPEPVTAAGLPMRRPAGRAAPPPPRPVPAPPPAPEPEPAPRADFRDPEAIRSNLSRHYSGMQAARRSRQDQREGNR